MKKIFLSATLPHLIGMLNSVLELIAENDKVETWLGSNPEFLSLLDVSAVWLDRLMGEDEDELEELAIDELREAIRHIAANLSIEAVVPFFETEG